MNDPTGVYDKYKPEPTDDQFRRLTDLVEQQAGLQVETIELEAELEKVKARYKELSEGLIPDLMQELSQDMIKTSSGITVEIRQAIRASISKANNKQAIQWLDDNDHSGLVKRKFTIQFNKNEETWANKFAADLAKRKKPVICEESKTVNPQTLSAFVRKQLEEGVEVPKKLLGVHEQKFAKLTVK